MSNVVEFKRAEPRRPARAAQKLERAERVAQYLHAAAELLQLALETAPVTGVPLPHALQQVLKDYRDDLNDVGVAIVARVWPPEECA